MVVASSGMSSQASEIDQDLRAGEEQAGYEYDSHDGGIKIEVAGDSRAHASDHPVVARAG